MKSKDGTQVSRRRFLEAAVVTAAGSKMVAAAPAPAPASASADAERARLEALVESYGSEFGDLRKVR